MLNALTPLIRGLLFAAIGLGIGVGLGDILAGLTDQPSHTEPRMALGYVLALIGWVMGIGLWKHWGKEWFGGTAEPNHIKGPARFFSFSTDHKVIGVQYLVTMVVIFLLAGVAALLLRAQLADAGGSLLDASDYNTVMSLHGIMMIAVAVAMIMGGFANFLLPLMIGADDVAFPRINALSFWIVPPVAVLLLITPIFNGFETGWTAYPPLSTSTLGPDGTLLFLFAFLTFGVSSILGGLNFIATVISKRAPGMTWSRLPIFVWAVFAASLLSLIATQWVAYAMLMLIMERIFNMSFFAPEIVSEGSQLLSSGNSVLFEHIFWFYSHPAVYIMILPAFGIELEIISHLTRKPIFAHKWVVRALFTIVAMSFMVWAHHLFTSGMGRELHGPFMVLTELISIPTGIIFLAALGTMWRGKMWLNTPMLFTLGMVFNFAIGGLTGIFLADFATDVSLHDTYFIVAHFHYTIVGGEVFAIMAALYYWFPKITGRMYNETLGKIHFAGMFLFFNITFLTMFIPGLEGMNRRVAEYPPSLEGINVIITIAAFAMGASFLPFIYNMANSWIRGPKAEANPWGARTLEWQTSSPPPEENFDEPPVVTEDPYGYGRPLRKAGPPAASLPSAPTTADGD